MNTLHKFLCSWIVFCGLFASVDLKKSRHQLNALRASQARNSQWSEPSQCSRTCGGGVAFREKICSNSGNGYQDECLEPERKYFLCNTQECPQGSEDFRAVQCQQFDSQPFDGKFYKWVPYYGAEDQCSLICLAKGEQFYRRLADKVVDGTPCNRNTLDICIDGLCQAVGCDRVLGSKKALDACLICGGYGATCRTQHGIIETEHLISGYNRLIVLPEGATSITVQEEGTSKNYFAVRNQNGVYYLNGNMHVGPAEPQYLGQTFFEYRRPHYGMEYLSALGPLQETLTVELLKQPGASPSVRYDYSVPSNASSNEVYSWIAQAWTQCNASCGIGYLRRVVSCTSLKTKREVDDDYCSHLQKPSVKEVCHRTKCTADWYVGEWETCSESCGSGTQVRKVFCHRTHDGDYKEVVSADQCQQPKPAAVQDCNVGVPCVEWEAGKWSECFGVCGTGEQTRAVICKGQQTDHSQNNAVLPDSSCDPIHRPSSHRSCDLEPCLHVEWMVSDWSGCSGGCDDAVETRQLKCSTRDGQLYPLITCDTARRPETSRPCPIDHSCNQHHQKLQWFTSQWSSCSKTCGTGVQRRNVFCGNTQSGQVVKVPSNRCDPESKLAEERECSGSECFGAWFTGPFGKCSAACGGGQRTRELFCFIGNESVDLKRCDENRRPDATEDCNQMACDEDNFLPSGASDCRQSEYGCCPDQFTAAEGPNYLGCASDPIPRGLCIDTEFGCCQDGLTPADGPFQYGCIPPSCKETRYGCCGDGETPAAGPDGKGCEKDESDSLDACQQSVFGCCPDSVTTRTGLNGEGCFEATQSLDFESSGSGDIPGCESSAYGCCPDGVTGAHQPGGAGCPDKATKVRHPGTELPVVIPTPTEPPSTRQQFTTPRTESTKAHITTSTQTESPTTTSSTMKLPTPTTATLHLPTTTTTTHVPTTTQATAEFPTPVSTSVHFDTPTQSETIPTVTHDALTARVTHSHPSGVSCLSSVYRCCLDGKTPAAGPSFQGCPWDEDRYMNTCEDAPYGCCPDGVTAAFGPNSAHCPHLLQRAVICTLPRDPGPCEERSVKWFFDAAYGNCVSFEYSGCGGNENRFDTSDACRLACISPEGIDRCYLPQSPGRCHRALIRFSYNPEAHQCDEFIYGGCLGNENRFSTVRDCEKSCVEPQRPDICNQPPQPGPCRAYIPRYYFDPKTESCRQFIYGGCRGNDNNFKSLDECEERCGESVVRICRLPLDHGPCHATFYQWYFNSESGQCEEFKYGGCLGNANRFRSKLECEKSCKKLLRTILINRCELSPDVGPCRARHERWFYDQSDGYCKQFVYGGCDGNENRFDSEPACRQACDANLPIDVCTLPADAGRCRASIERYFFDGETNQCLRFIFGGCEGNGNNFRSIEECQTKCSEHIYLTLPPGTNRCLLPRDPGPCIASMIRWHYSPIDRRCVKFEYGGCGGNRNRFLMEGVCNRECDYLSVTTRRIYGRPTDAPVVEHPAFIPSEHDERVVISTTPSLTHSIADEWEEVDISSQAPTQSLKETDNEVPVLPVDEVPTAPSDDVQNTLGDEVENLIGTPGYYVPDVPGRPESWMGIGSPTVGTEALSTDVGFFSYEVTLEETLKLPQKEETPVDYVSENFKESEDGGSGALSNASPATFTESLLMPHHLAPTPSKVELLQACSLHANPGSCKNHTYRWFYDQERGECLQFKFGGCEENANNFYSREECERACPVKDICQLPSEVGLCDAIKRRYFFDTASGICQLFIYGGCSGNANRFLMLENCQRVCGTMVLAATPTERETTTVSTTTAPPSAVEDHGDICSLPMDGGRCRAYFLSYFFDGATSSCQEFVWGGCGGNANRFSTKSECEQKCLDAARHFPVALLPEPTVPSNIPPTVAAPADPVSVFGRRRWDACKMHKDPGPCEDYRVVWYFEPIGRHCRRFYYGGCGGNENKFNSSEECHSRCLWSELSILPPVDPQTAQEATSTQTTPTVVDHVTPALSTHVTPTSSGIHMTQALTKAFLASTARSWEEPSSHDDEVAEGEPVIGTCDLPMDAGSYCSGWQEYWYYEFEHSRCRRFYYGGCDGNANRFTTEEECASTCIVPGQVSATAFEVDVCLEPKDTGPCTLSEVRWYYDQSEGRCLNFTYGGCHGNPNNFDTERDCMTICKAHLKELEAEAKDVCHLPKDAGPCLADYLRYYFSPEDSECRPFIYGGCQGNGNNFATQEECYRSCRGNETVNVVSRMHNPGDCFLPAVAGPCVDMKAKWYYDVQHGDCRGFYYGGCLGNGNNFLDYEDCLVFCSKVSEACGVLQCDLECPYGFVHGADSCPVCQCLYPCQNVECPENTRCQVENVTCGATLCTNEHKAVCKPIMSKPGSCPPQGEFGENTVECRVTCRSDNDCDGQAKCCRQGCNQHCVSPQQPDCAKSVFHCCPDGKTPAMGWNYRGCPEEVPVIEPYPDVVTVIQHSDLLLSCSARGAPRPQVTWYRDNIPIVDGASQKREITILTNGTLFLANVVTDDAKATYSCRAYNNIGADTHTYSLIVYVPAEIENEAEIETISTIRGSTIQLSCIASGIPIPSVTWFKDRELMSSNAKDKHELSGTGLQISNVDSADAGQYICRAKNGVGSAKQKLFEVKLIEFLSAEVIAQKTNITAGDDIKLHCQVSNENAEHVHITWSFNGQPLTSENRYKVKALGELVIESTKTSDGGVYSCTVTRGRDQATSSVVINVHARKLPEKCVDKPWYANCELIVEAGLCRHAYFSIFCCSTCHRAGHLP